MSENSNKTIEKYGDEEEKEKVKKNPKEIIELFPPLDKKPEAPKILVQIENTCVLPKVGIVGKSENIIFIGHPKPVIKLILVKTPNFQNHLCSLSKDGRVKLWDLTDSKNPKCIKCINLNFESWDILLGNNNNIIICGEEILMYNLENDSKIIVMEKSYYKFVEYNLLARINDNLGVCTSLNDYYLVFDLNNGKIIKKIEMDKTHFICQMEKNIKLQKEREEQRKKELEKKEKEENLIIPENEDEGKEKDEKDKKKKKDEIKIYIRDLGSGKCEEYEEGHKGHVHALLGINTEQYKDTIISGAEDNLVKLININNPIEVTSLSGHNNTIESLELDNSKQFLFSGSLDYIIKKWDLNTKECISTMRFNKAFHSILLYLDNDYLLSIGVNSKIRIWNKECLNVKTYIYTNGTIKSGLKISYDKEYNKVKIVFGDNKGDIFIKDFIIEEEYVNKYNEYKNKLLREQEEKLMKTKTNIINRKSGKQTFRSDDFDTNFRFKESTYETEHSEI